MCLICVDMSYNRLTSIEAKRNLTEIKSTISKKHVMEVYQLIWDKEDEERDTFWVDGDKYGDTD